MSLESQVDWEWNPKDRGHEDSDRYHAWPYRTLLSLSSLESLIAISFGLSQWISAHNGIIKSLGELPKKITMPKSNQPILAGCISQKETELKWSLCESRAGPDFQDLKDPWGRNHSFPLDQHFLLSSLSQGQELACYQVLIVIRQGGVERINNTQWLHYLSGCKWRGRLHVTAINQRPRNKTTSSFPQIHHIEELCCSLAVGKTLSLQRKGFQDVCSNWKRKGFLSNKEAT
jgi:hypothetical protein